MDVDEVLAGLSPADRAALLERLLAEAEGEGDLDARVRRLETLVGGAPGRGPRWAGRYRRGPGSGDEGPWGHHHCHCPHCG